MKSRRLIARAFGTCCLFALSSATVLAQGTTGSGTTSGTNPFGSSGNSAASGRPSGASGTTSSSQNTQLQSSTIGAGSATSIPAVSNNIAPWYGDPLSMGLASKYVNGPVSPNSSATRPSVTFGKANYASTTATGAGAAASAATNQTNGFTTVGTPRNPQYTTVLSEDVPLVVHKTDVLQSEIRDVINRSEKLKSKNAIQIAVTNGIVILSGQVGTDRERQVAEAIIGMRPGVRGVQNDLTIAPTK